MAVEVREAATPDEFALARELIVEYLDFLPFDVDFQDVDAELADLPRVYGPPDGAVLLAFVDESPAGVVGVSRFDERACEMKRMFVRAAYRSHGVGRRLGEDAIGLARRLGYERMLLDTVRELEDANALYESLGFRDVPAYRHNPRPDARYFELVL